MAHSTYHSMLRLIRFTTLALSALVVTSIASEEPNGMEAAYTEDGAQACLTCHGPDDDYPAHQILATPHGVMGDPDSPFGEGQHDCEACHGPSQAHMTRNPDGSRPGVDFNFGPDTSAEAKNAVCENCHAGGDRFHWPGSTHEFEEVACVNCHSVHVTDDPVLAIETQPEVCYDCHQEQRAQFLRQSRHPVQAQTADFSHTGLMSCSGCHNPHGSATDGMLVRNTLNETCWDCHAEKRGPFLFEHAPVREDCSNCHVPHGSNHQNLLSARQPWMCQQCHIANFHPSGVYSGTGIPPDGADQRVLGKQCLNCHSQIHGSNHPSGIRLTR
jgi:DmsE family decaheme c-type cytochrome